MLRLERILIARDDSPCSDLALNEALWLAQQTGAELHVLRVDVLLGEPMRKIDDPASEIAKIRERLARVIEARSPRDKAFDPQSVRIFHRTVRGLAPAPAIIDYAAEHDMDLIVMGTHGRRGVRRLLIGSVAEEVVRRAPCPVFTVRETKDEEESVKRLKSILVPIDFSEHSKDALRYAGAFAELYGAELQLLHVFDEFSGPGFLMDEVLATHDVRLAIEERSIEDMKRLAREVVGSTDRLRVQTIIGHPAPKILETASTNDVDLIVMSTHGLTGLEHLVMGSVAEKVVRQAPCPVLTIKAFGKSLMDTKSGLAVATE